MVLTVYNGQPEFINGDTVIITEYLNVTMDIWCYTWTMGLNCEGLL